MNKLVIVLLVVVVACTSAQFGGNKRLNQRQLRAQQLQNSELSAAERQHLLEQFKLQKQQRRQARIQAKKERRERRRQRLAKKEAARLRAQQKLAAEEFDNGAKFSKFDAKVNHDEAKKFGLQIVSHSTNSHSASISADNGSKFSRGSKLGLASNVEADAVHSVDAASDAEAADLDHFAAAGDDASSLNAGIHNQRDHEARIAARNRNQNQLGFHNSGFDNNLFGF